MLRRRGRRSRGDADRRESLPVSHSGSEHSVPCNAPFTSLYLDPRGEVRACCQNVWQRLGNVSEQSLLSIWRGDQARRLQEAMLDGDLSLGCERCAEHIDTGRPESAYARVFDKLGRSERFPDWPVQLELALSNSCNLQCVMCNGELSSAIRIHREKRPPMPEVYGEEFFESLDDFLPHLRSLVFLGGEPFLAKESMRVMDRLVDLGLSPACSITTNGTQWNDRVERMVTSLPTFVSISVDGIERSTFEAIRIGADHDRVMENVQRFKRATEGAGGGTSLAFCLMRNNWREFPELLLWAEDAGMSVYVNSVEHPPNLSFVNATAHELREIVDTLEPQHDSISKRLERNRAVWEQELTKFQHLLTERETSVTLAGSAVHDRSDPPPGPRGRLHARVEVGSDQLVVHVHPGETSTVGLDLASMTGGAVWDLQPYLCRKLGEIESTQLSRFDDGREELQIRYSTEGGALTMHAVLTPGEDGAQTWDLDFTPGEAAIESPRAESGDNPSG